MRAIVAIPLGVMIVAYLVHIFCVFASTRVKLRRARKDNRAGRAPAC